MRLSLRALEKDTSSFYEEMSSSERRRLIKIVSREFYREYLAGRFTQDEVESGMRTSMGLMFHSSPLQARIEAKSYVLENKINA